MTVDLSPIINDALGVAGIGVSVFGMWALQRLAAKFGVQISAGNQLALNLALNKAIAAGSAGAETLAAEKGWSHPDVKNAVVSGALEFLADNGDAALKKAGLDPVANQATIAAHIEAMLPTSLAPIAASPVTTNGPPPAPSYPFPTAPIHPITVPPPPHTGMNPIAKEGSDA